MTIKEAPLSEVWKLRQEVMYPQASIDAVKLDDDQAGLHLGLYEGEQLLTVISLFVSDQIVQFRKFATHTAFQRKGYGTFLLQYAMEWAQASNCKMIWCNARLTATEFYQRFDMDPVGEVWEKNGIEYIKMQKKLHRTWR